MNRTISIGQLADRTGLAVSAIRYYEERGLVSPERSAGGQRRFLRSDIRKLSFVMIAQSMGFSIEEIAALLADLPGGRAPTAEDWASISPRFREAIDARILALTRMRDKLESCIGCGCLSLKTCALYNAEDRAAHLGAGPRFLLGDTPDSVSPSDSEAS